MARKRRIGSEFRESCSLVLLVLMFSARVLFEVPSCLDCKTLESIHFIVFAGKESSRLIMV